MGVEKCYDAKKWKMVRNGIKVNGISRDSKCEGVRKWMLRNGKELRNGCRKMV